MSADAWLQTWIPKILASPAFAQDGVLVITFDESDGPQSDADACCGEGPGPNTPLPGISGLGGGRVGALVISRSSRPGTWSTTPYNHYSLLASIEELFGLSKLGYAADARPEPVRPRRLQRRGLTTSRPGPLRCSGPPGRLLKFSLPRAECSYYNRLRESSGPAPE